MSTCAFCERIAGGHEVQLVGSAAWFPDEFPVSPNHTLVVPTRHVESVFELQPDELRDVWRAVIEVREQLTPESGEVGFNVGVNAGRTAGQTIEHAHAHVIPRYPGDVGDPRGGIRWVLPDKARYW